MCYNYHRVPSEAVTIRQVLTSHKSFKNKELSYHLVRQWWSSREPFAEGFQNGFLAKDQISCISSSTEGQFRNGNTTTLCFFAEKSPETQIGGFPVNFL